MPAETRSGVKVETYVAPSLREKYKRHCKKLKISVAQRLRDLMQDDMKKK